MQETQVLSLGQEDPLEKEMATHSSILAWKTPWTEEPGGLQSMGLQSQTWLSSRCGMAHGIYIASGIIINLEIIYSIWAYLYVNTASFYIRDLGILRFSYPQGVLVSIPHGYWGWPISLKMPVISGWCTNTGNEKSLSHSLSGKYSYLWIYSMWSLTTCPGISQSSLQLKWCWNFHRRVGNFQSCSGEI